MSILIHVGTWFAEVETIKRQIGATCGCMATGQSSWPWWKRKVSYIVIAAVASCWKTVALYLVFVLNFSIGIFVLCCSIVDRLFCYVQPARGEIRWIKCKDAQDCPGSYTMYGRSSASPCRSRETTRPSVVWRYTREKAVLKMTGRFAPSIILISNASTSTCWKRSSAGNCLSIIRVNLRLWSAHVSTAVESQSNKAPFFVVGVGCLFRHLATSDWNYLYTSIVDRNNSGPVIVSRSVPVLKTCIGLYILFVRWVFALSPPPMFSDYSTGSVPGKNFPRNLEFPPEILTMSFWSCEIPLM